MRAPRALVWIPLVAAAGLLLALAPPPEAGGAADVVQSVPRAPAPAPASADAPSVQADAAEAVLGVRRRLPEPEAAGSAYWRLGPVEPPPAAVRAPPVLPAPYVAASAPPPAQPSAPALPYRMIGRYVDGDQEGVVLQGPDGALVIVHAGDRLGDTYRVESLTGNLMVLNYLPLNERQTMDIGIAR